MLSRAIHDGRKAALVAVVAAGAIAAAAVAPAPVSAGRTVSVGAYISNADNNPALIDDFNAQVDRDAAIIVSYSRGDLRVDSSGPALAALRSSLGSPLYASSREALLSTSLDRGR